MIYKPASAFGTIVLTMTLAACGGGEDGGTPTPTPPPVTNPGFTQSATWSVVLPAAGNSLCYDFNAKAVVADCTGKAWDLKLKSSGRTSTFWTNSGTSGTGEGGAFGGPFDHSWAELQKWENATTDPVAGAIPSTLFFKDAASGVFTGSNEIASTAFEYGIGGSTDHLLYPNYRTFLITSDSSSADTTGTPASPVFALQVTGYYGGSGGTTSGHPSFRWIDRNAPGDVRTATVNASVDWVYYDLVAGATSTASGTWHIAFNRYTFKLNGGESGSGKVAGFLAKTPAGFYDPAGTPITAKFTDASNLVSTAADLNAPDLTLPSSASKWVKDTASSPLQPAYTGTYPNPLDYGWFTYYPTATAAGSAGLPAIAHLIRANSEAAGLLRGGEGNTYARFHVTQILYADPNDAASQQTWTIEFDVQP